MFKLLSLTCKDFLQALTERDFRNFCFVDISQYQGVFLTIIIMSLIH
jgi:hypothetical protein